MDGSLSFSLVIIKYLFGEIYGVLKRRKLETWDRQLWHGSTSLELGLNRRKDKSNPLEEGGGKNGVRFKTFKLRSRIQEISFKHASYSIILFKLGITNVNWEYKALARENTIVASHWYRSKSGIANLSIPLRSFFIPFLPSFLPLCACPPHPTLVPFFFLSSHIHFRFFVRHRSLDGNARALRNDRYIPADVYRFNK